MPMTNRFICNAQSPVNTTEVPFKAQTINTNYKRYICRRVAKISVICPIQVFQIIHTVNNKFKHMHICVYIIHSNDLWFLIHVLERERVSSAVFLVTINDQLQQNGGCYFSHTRLHSNELPLS